MTKLKVAIITVDYVNCESKKLKFVSRSKTFDYLKSNYCLTDSQLLQLETNLVLNVEDSSGFTTNDFYLIEWE